MGPVLAFLKSIRGRLRALQNGHAYNPQALTAGYFTREIARYGWEIGHYTYGLPHVAFAQKGAPLRIGNYGSIAKNVTIFLGGNHALDGPTTYPFSSFPQLWPEAAALRDLGQTRGGVTIGSDVWIGDGALILSGVVIGDGAVIGARAVVTKSVPPYAIVAGNPARLIRYRFDDARIAQLLALRWWDLPRETVATLTPLLLGQDVDALIAALKRLRAASDAR